MIVNLRVAELPGYIRGVLKDKGIGFGEDAQVDHSKGVGDACPFSGGIIYGYMFDGRSVRRTDYTNLLPK